jgi:hypothetical protein
MISQTDVDNTMLEFMIGINPPMLPLTVYTHSKQEKCQTLLRQRSNLQGNDGRHGHEDRTQLWEHESCMAPVEASSYRRPHHVAHPGARRNQTLNDPHHHCPPTHFGGRQALVLGLSLTLGEMDIFLETKPHKNSSECVFHAKAEKQQKHQILLGSALHAITS